MHPPAIAHAVQNQITDKTDVVVFVGSSQTFRDCHLHVLEAEFPGIVASRFNDVRELIDQAASYSGSIKTIIFDEALISDLRETIGEIRLTFPWPIVAVAVSQQCPQAAAIERLMGEGLFGSLLPMDLRLNVWLSAIRLMASGGDYLPPRFSLVSAGTPAGERPVAPAKTARQLPVQGRNGSAVDRHLTPRETEVLALLELGLQNKNIADQLRLSEHTIKLHIHRIISKLGASNRTQAVAIYQSRVPHG